MTVSLLRHNSDYGGCNQFAAPKEVCLQAVRKTNSDDADVTCCGKLFQTLAAATRKAPSPIVDNRVRWTISNGEEAEHRRRRASEVCWLAKFVSKVRRGEQQRRQ